MSARIGETNPLFSPKRGNENVSENSPQKKARLSTETTLVARKIFQDLINSPDSKTPSSSPTRRNLRFELSPLSPTSTRRSLGFGGSSSSSTRRDLGFGLSSFPLNLATPPSSPLPSHSKPESPSALTHFIAKQATSSSSSTSYITPPTSPLKNGINAVPASPDIPMISPFNFSTSSSRLPPETPWRPTSRMNKRHSPYVTKALSIYQNSLSNPEFSPIPGFRLEKISGAAGEHSQVYKVATNTNNEQLVPGISNDDILVKMHQHKHFQQTPKLVDSYLENSLIQYDDLKNRGKPISRIYNRETIKNDGYLIVERVTPLAELSKSWQQPDVTIENLPEKTQTILREIRELVDFAWNDPSTIPLDLQISNLGINREEKVVLFDFMEHAEDRPYGFRLIAKKCVNNIAGSSTSLSNYLVENLKKNDLQAYNLHFLSP